MINENADMEKIKSRFKFNMPSFMQQNLFIRIISILILAPVFIWITYKGGTIYNTLLCLIAFISIWEWQRVVGIHNTKWFIAGSIYVLIAIFGLFFTPSKAHLFLQTHSTINDATAFLFLLYTIVWATDCGAYITGKCLKGPKLCPKISPNKTWAGFIGGVIFALFFTNLTLHTFKIQISLSIPHYIITILLSIAAHIGDLIESATKRYFHVKDVSQIIPGHGGVLDRLDSLLFISIISLILIVLYS